MSFSQLFFVQCYFGVTFFESLSVVLVFQFIAYTQQLRTSWKQKFTRKEEKEEQNNCQVKKYTEYFVMFEIGKFKTKKI